MGMNSFLRGAHIFKLRPIVLNCVQHIFPGGAKIFQIFLGGFSPCASLVTGLCVTTRNCWGSKVSITNNSELMTFVEDLFQEEDKQASAEAQAGFKETINQ